MPIGAAIGGSAVIGAGASISASNKASKAAKGAAAQNNALQQQIYNQNAQTLSPYVQAGNAATPAIQALLGLGGGADYNAYLQANPDIAADYARNQAAQDAGSLQDYARWHYTNYGAKEGRNLPTSTGAEAQMQALNNFRNAAGYQDQFAEGQRAVTTALGGRGLLDSGAAQKALVKYGNYQASQSLQSYLQNLVQQQGVGLGAASAQAGVGQNYANAVGANNANAANTAGNAALANAGNINSALQQGVSAYTMSQGLGSSYGGGNPYGGKLGGIY